MLTFLLALLLGSFESHYMILHYSLLNPVSHIMIELRKDKMCTEAI